MCRYEWHGITSLTTKLAQLRNEAEQELQGPSNDAIDDKRERSMTRLSQRFAQMFMLSKLGALELEAAATALLGPTEEGEKTKTKVRRLYDIANIMW